MSKPNTPLIYHRTQQLIELARAGEESGLQYFFPGSGRAFCSGDGAAGIAFFWDMDEAFWQARDLNRIQDWAQYLAGLLTLWGYPVQTQSKRRWLDGDIPNRPDIDPVFPGVPIEERYAPDFVSRLVHVPDDAEVQQRWVYDRESGAFHPAATAPTSGVEEEISTK